MGMSSIATERKYRKETYENYVRVQSPQWEQHDAGADAVWIRATLHRLRGWLPEDKSAKCLDIGCGAGLFMEAFRVAGYANVTGVDICEDSVRLARSRGFQVTQTDLREYLAQTDEQLDLISALDVIEHFGKDELLDLLRLVRGRLAPGGRFILQTPNALSPWAASYRYHDLTHELIFDPHCLTSVLQLAGFKSIRIREIAPYVHGLASALRWVAWRMISSACAAWNLAETGTRQGGIYTRNMVAVAVRPLDGSC